MHGFQKTFFLQLFGHKKASVPIYAAGLTLLEPVKGSSEGMLKPDVLVDTMKTDNGSQQSQVDHYEILSPPNFNPLLYDKILDQCILKVFADCKCDLKIKFCFRKGKDIHKKGETDGHQHFLLFQKFF